jgi:hypothetical protein
MQAAHANDLVADAVAVAKDYGSATKQSTAELAQIPLQNNLARNVRRRFRSEIPLDVVELPLQNADGEMVFEDVWVLAPDKLWQYFCDKGVLFEMLLGDTNLSKFWQSLSSTPLGRRILGELPASQWKDLIPFRFHGDDVEGYKDVSFTMISWAGLTREKSKRFLICSFEKRQQYIDGTGCNHTLSKLGQFVTASFQKIRDRAVFPGAMLCCQGDLAWFRDWFMHMQHKRYYNCVGMCFVCLATASKKETKYWDMTPTAPWRSLTSPCPSIQPLNNVPWFSHDMMAMDTLHVLFLGFSEVCNGLGISILLRSQTSLQIFNGWRDWCRAFDYKPRSTVHCIRAVESRPRRLFPMVTTAKGYDQKVLSFWLSTQFEALHSHSPEAATAIWYLAKFLATCDKASDVLTDEEAGTAADALEAALSVWVYGALMHRQAPIQFKIIPKFHYCAHLAIQVRTNKLNPRWFSTLDGESFVGDMAKLTSGVHRRTAGRSILEKVALQLELELSGMLTEL